MSLAEKSALVVGGGTGIGLAIAQALAEAGAKVAIAGRRFEVLEQGAASSSAEIHCHSVDVSDRKSVLDLFAWADQTLGKVDILVNAAGVNIKNRSMEAMTPEDWDRMMQINSTGAYNLMYAALPQMRERKDGLIINISSIAGKRAIALGGIAYAASKFAMTALGTAAGNEENKHGVRITNIYPGEVDTPLLKQRPKPVTEEHRATMLQPEDFKEVVLAICNLPPRAHVPELIVKPTTQEYV
ncbi:SDR family oxidoreductase [Blastopirellula sp. J2-11]|uniref:SDR family oxidoreductase n=1 Tax=Blastopirellula sp. J2-11 TaxID=2943192 RepID=UPI0021CA8603|nr:SDR family oxidoreductase [Blastopirellula sp. J2-11]UUO08166.1 SDR family oxidoreductase [Blastopirellula sp. J2-11]